MSAAKANRQDHRDATILLVACRHGLRASEVCDLRWDQVDFIAAVLVIFTAMIGDRGDLPRHIHRAGGWTPGARNRSRPVAFHLDVRGSGGWRNARSEGERWPSTLSVPRYTPWTCSPPYLSFLDISCAASFQSIWPRPQPDRSPTV
jgi:integrase